MTRGRILLTGAAGFTGGHACRHFAAAGFEVAAVVRHTAAAEEWAMANPAAEAAAQRAFICELTDGAAVKELVRLAQPDYVLHLAGMNSVPESWRSPVPCMEANMLATMYLLEAVRLERPDCRFLAVGSMMGSPGEAPPAHPYGLSKALQAAVALAWSRLFGQPVLLARASNLVGPGPSKGLCGLLAAWAAEAERNGGAAAPFTLSSYDEQRDFLDVRDAVAAYETILLHGRQGHVYDIGSCVNRTIGEMAEAFRRHSAVPLPFALKPNALPQPAPEPVDPDAMARLGWSPAVPFEQSIADAFHYFRQRRH